MTTNPRSSQLGARPTGAGSKDGKSNPASKIESLTNPLGVSPIREEIKEETSIDESWDL
jgi:hypothetical protein